MHESLTVINGSYVLNKYANNVRSSLQDFSSPNNISILPNAINDNFSWLHFVTILL